MKFSSPFLISAARRFHNAEPYLHNIIVVVALVFAVAGIFSGLSVQIDPAGFHLDWKATAGIILLVLQGVLYCASRLYLKRAESVPIGELTAEPKALPKGIAVAEVKTQNDTKALADYLNAHYPTAYISQLRLNTRREMYDRWMTAAPGFARVVRHTNQGKTKVVGCCILLPISVETFAAYRNGLGSPDAWTSANLSNKDECRVLFMPSLHIDKTRALRKVAPDVLAELFASFACLQADNTEQFVIVAPIRTAGERNNARKMGFEMFRHSKAGFELWELDGRRTRELSQSARTTLAVLNDRKAGA